MAREAACRDTDPDLFFPVGTTGPGDRADREGQGRLPAVRGRRRACLEFALTTNQDSGIWGGTSEEERRKLRRQYVARQKAVAV